MGTKRKLRRIGRTARNTLEPLRPEAPNSPRKLSEVLLEFAQPLLDTVGDDAFENVISFAAICWNISFFPEPKQPRRLKRIIKQLSKSDRHMRCELSAWAKALVERKKTFFAHDKRMIFDYEVVEEQDSYHLFVMSSLAKE